MKIALDITPISGAYTGHKVRGVGFYLTYLKRALENTPGDTSFIFFTQGQEIPHDVDLVHYPYFEPFHVTLPLVKKQKRVVTVHDLTPLVFPKQFPAGIKGTVRWNLQRYNLLQTDGIITDSVASKKDILKLVGAKAANVHVAYLAAAEEFKVLPVEKKKEIKKKYNLPEQFALYVGDVTWNKNLPRLMKAAQSADVPLVMVGKALVEDNFDRKNPWNKDRIIIQELAEDTKHFIRLGFLPTEDVVALYNAATVFVYPSVYEGFGLPVLEAMQSGCPVITTRESSLPEVAGDAALYINGYDEDAISYGLTKMLSTKQLRDDFQAKGFLQAKQFSWEKTAEKTIAAYKSTLER